MKENRLRNQTCGSQGGGEGKIGNFIYIYIYISVQFSRSVVSDSFPISLSESERERERERERETGKQWKQWQTLFGGGSKITADGDYSHEIKRCLEGKL